MFKVLQKLKYGARVLLSLGGGTPETIDVAGRSTVTMHGGEGDASPFVYLHSTLGESSMWLPFYQTWSKKFRVLVPTHPGFGKSAGFDQIDTIEDMAFHYVEMFDALGLEQVILGGVSLGGWIAAEFAVRWPERVKKLWIAAAPGLWVEEEPLPDLFRIMHDTDKMRQLLFHDPSSAIAGMVIRDKVDDQTMMQVYQNMTVLARLVWERPYDPKLAQRLQAHSVPHAAGLGRPRQAGAAGLRRGVQEAHRRGRAETDQGLRPPADVRKRGGVRADRPEVLRGNQIEHAALVS